MAESTKPCECGCGLPTLLRTRDNPTVGYRKGEPARFLPGHNMRSPHPEYVEQDMGYATPCWVWQRATNLYGYGHVSNNLKHRASDGSRMAHRVVYERHKGPIPEGLQLDHLCRVRSCVNPDHLEPVTCRENLLRGKGPTAIHAQTTHCPSGHPYDEVNTYRNPKTGHRQCRACDLRRQNAKYRRKVAEKALVNG